MFDVAAQGLSTFHFIEEMEVIDDSQQSGKKEWLILLEVAVSKASMYLIPEETEWKRLLSAHMFC